MVLVPMTREEILAKGTPPGEDEIEIKQDMEISLALYSASGEEMLEQDALALEPQAQSQDAQHGQDKEIQVAILLEGGEGESATGEQNHKALKSIYR